MSKKKKEHMGSKICAVVQQQFWRTYNLGTEYEAALGKSLASRSMQSKPVRGAGSVSSVPSGMRAMQLFCERQATILCTMRLGGEGKGMLNHQGTPSVLVPWAYNFVKQNLISFEGNSNAAQWLTLHSFCCAFHGLGPVGKMLPSSASVLRGFCLIGLKAFSLHFTPQPSFHPSQRTGKRSWSFISKEKGVAMGLSNGHVQWAWRARSSVVLFVFPTGFDRMDSILWGFQHCIMSSKSSCLFSYIRFMLAWNSLGVREANLSLFNVL